MYNIYDLRKKIMLRRILRTVQDKLLKSKPRWLHSNTLLSLNEFIIALYELINAYECCMYPLRQNTKYENGINTENYISLYHILWVNGLSIDMCSTDLKAFQQKADLDALCT